MQALFVLFLFIKDKAAAASSSGNTNAPILTGLIPPRKEVRPSSDIMHAIAHPLQFFFVLVFPLKEHFYLSNSLSALA